jgi:uracil phosphoribosyltransferase
MSPGFALVYMSIEERDEAAVVTHAIARDVLTHLRDVETEQVAFREGLVRLGRICGYEIIDDRFETMDVTIETPLTTTSGQRLRAMEDVVIVNVLRAATPFVEGLLKAFPSARQGVISASREEDRGRAPDGSFPISIDYVKLPDVGPDDRVIVADPMLATGSTLETVLQRVIDAGARPEQVIVLSAVSAPTGLERLRRDFPAVDLVTVAVDDELDADGFIVPGLGDAGDRAFGTNE